MRFYELNSFKIKLCIITITNSSHSGPHLATICEPIEYVHDATDLSSAIQNQPRKNNIVHEDEQNHLLEGVTVSLVTSS